MYHSILTFVVLAATALPAGFDPIPDDPRVDDLVLATLERNPRLEAARAAADAAGVRRPAVGALPEPSATVRWFVESPETRVGPQRLAVELGQRVPWAGKRRLATRIADHELAARSAAVDELAQRLVGEVLRAYLEAGYVQEALAVNREQAELLQRFEQSALTRYATGEGIQQSAIRVQADLSRLADQAFALRERLDSLRARLARLSGRPRLELELSGIDLGSGECDGATIDASMSEHPRLARLDAAVRASETTVERRRLDRRPDMAFGLAWIGVDDRRDPAGRAAPPPDDGRDVWALSVGASLPIRRRALAANEAEARAARRMTAAELEVARDELAEQAREASRRHEWIERRIAMYRDVLVPQAEHALSSAESAYRTGRVGFLDLLDAERVLFDVRLTERRLVADHAIALVDLAQAAGTLPSEPGGVR